MKNGWQTKRLGELCEVFADGDWIESKDQSSDGIRLIQTGNVGEGVFKDRAKKARYISEATFKRLRCTEIVEGDCLISRLPDPVGRSCILPDTGERMITAVDCTILRFKPKQCLPVFFNFYSQSDEYLGTVAKKCTGTTRSRISRSNLGLIPIPVPPLPEQKRIVGILDEAFEGIAVAKVNAEKNLQNARTLFESHLQSVFNQRGEGWMEKKLEQIGTTQTGSTPKTSERDNYGDFIAFIKPADFNKDGSLDYENDGLSKKGLSLARKVASGSVLMVCIGATIGKCGYCDRDVTTNQQINSLTPSRGVSHKFLYYQMLTASFQQRVLLSSGQATLPIINKSKWSALTVGLPPTLEEQKRITSIFDALSSETQRLESIYHQKLTALDELKKSLLNQAFNGDL
ncbi:MAG: restriction endonuclease subunit S [Candidatus Vecturithrix sp.]|jgi:type I restriction enzyme S subunit|nr:restriction endonuclease subunit S [Candidatus Vecturithrix sp.]